MSHTVTIQVELKDPAALEAACRRLQLPLPTRGPVRLFDRIAEGTGIQLDGWRFPICLTDRPSRRRSSRRAGRAIPASSRRCPMDRSA